MGGVEYVVQQHERLLPLVVTDKNGCGQIIHHTFTAQVSPVTAATPTELPKGGGAGRKRNVTSTAGHDEQVLYTGTVNPSPVPVPVSAVTLQITVVVQETAHDFS